jgi:hypothetical protein
VGSLKKAWLAALYIFSICEKYYTLSLHQPVGGGHHYILLAPYTGRGMACISGIIMIFLA